MRHLSLRTLLVTLALTTCLGAISACGRHSSRSSPSASAADERSYLDRRGAFQTKLTRIGAAPQEFQAQRPPPGVEEVTYQSGALSLKAWLAFPPNASASARVPGIVYFHGGFALGADDFEAARPFLDAGLAVLCPTLRGENGNPGTFEMFLGEVDDAKAAVTWLAANDRVDPLHIYTFGHSAGGVISALLSLQDVPIRHGGSSGGLYGPSFFEHLGGVPFARDDPAERELRVLVGNIKWMKRTHYAFVGETDRAQAGGAARKEATSAPPYLKIASLPGDHFSSLPDAVASYIKVIKESP